MSKWGNIGKPLTAIMIFTLIGISLISSVLIYSSYQTSLGKLDSFATNNFNEELSQEAGHFANTITYRLKLAEAQARTATKIFASNSDAANPDRTIEIFNILGSSGLDPVMNMIRLNRDGIVTNSGGKISLFSLGDDVSNQRFFELATFQNRTILQQVAYGPTQTYLALGIPIYEQSQQQPAFVGEVVLFLDSRILGEAVIDELSITDSRIKFLMLAKDGLIVYDSSAELKARNIQENAAFDFLDPKSRESVTKALDQLLKDSRKGTVSYASPDGTSTTISYAPIFLDDSFVYGAALFGSASQSNTLIGLLDAQSGLLIVGIILIIAAPGIFIGFILIMNRKLVSTVDYQESKIIDQYHKLQLTYEKLKEADILKDEFINIAAHELRTPVLPIILSAENLSDELPNNSKIQSILRNAKRISKLTNDILDVSRIESNTFKLQKQQTNIRSLIEDLVKDFSFKISHIHELVIKTDFSKLPLEFESIMIDKSRITQVVGNLIDNAANFTEKGSILVRVEGVAGTDRKYVKISIIDTGTGIDPEVKDKLFGKFITKSPNARGTGLGLYVSKAIVEAHDGTISADNNPEGKGSIFSFILPMI